MSDFNHAQLRQTEEMRAELIREASDKRDAFSSLKGDINNGILEVLTKLDALQQKVKANMKTDQNPDGLLTRSEFSYIACLSIRHAPLENLLMQDEVHWAINYELAVQKGDQLQEKI